MAQDAIALGRAQDSTATAHASNSQSSYLPDPEAER
jgi:hypothetical protein